jgi:hypothetical protein
VVHDAHAGRHDDEEHDHDDDVELAEQHRPPHPFLAFGQPGSAETTPR